MAIITSRCLVLQSRPFGDTSKILRLLTVDRGPISVIARGALRPKSRISGVTEPFAEGVATVYMKPNRDLHTLSSFELLRARQDLGADMSRFVTASLLCELVLRLAPQEADLTLFETLRSGLDVLLEVSAPEVPSASLVQIWRLVGYLGFSPALDDCFQCGRSLGPGEGARFDTSLGGVRCTGCGGTGTRLTNEQLDLMRAFVQGRPMPGQSVGPEQLRILTDFVRYHPADGLRLRSLEYLAAGLLS
ncbi:MAG: DNA repair protein RecO [Gemmatimonadota bacterium]